jgi:hypothetical protein
MLGNLSLGIVQRFYKRNLMEVLNIVYFILFGKNIKILC